MDIAVALVALVVGAGIGFALGRGGSGKGRQEAEAGLRAEAEARVRAAAAAVARGGLPEGGAPGSAEAELRQALESGWAPREEEHQRALREALARIGGFLDRAIRAPLAGAGSNADAGELRERIERALGGIQDLEFFLAEPGSETRGENVSALVQKVTREFALDQDVTVKLRMGGPVRAAVNPASFMDALYLVLHNAARFGTDQSVAVTVVAEDGRAVVRVRDHGPGFSEEAFRKAFDPFYSTTEDGLGLGLPHARKALERMGGRIDLANSPDGGAEVEISLPGS